MKIIKAFRMDVTPPKQPKLNWDDPENALEEWGKWNEKTEEVFEYALVRMRLCSFLGGFIYHFDAPPVKLCVGYKWCPHDKWYNTLYREFIYEDPST